MDSTDRRLCGSIRLVCSLWRECLSDSITWLSPRCLAKLSISQFHGLKELTLKRCANSGQDQTTSTISAVSSLQNLTTLDVSGLSCFNDAVLDNIAKGLPSLSTLLMDRCDCVSDRGAGFLVSFSSLTHLSMCACSQITSKGVAYLAALPRLLDLNLARCKHVDDRALTALAKNQTPLERLTLAWTRRITNAGLLSVAQLSTLRDLKFIRLREVSGTGLAYLGFLPQLQRLTLEWCDGVDGMYLNALKNLKSLNLSWSDNVTDSGVACIARLELLENLDLANCVKVTDHGMASISSLGKLRSLNLSYCRAISDRSLAGLSNLPSLQVLVLDACDRITDKGLQGLWTCPTLTYISLGGCHNITHRARDRLLKALPGLCVETTLKDNCSSYFAKLTLLGNDGTH